MLNFTPSTESQQAQLLASHMPTGKMWANCFNTNSNIGRTIAGLAVELYRFEVLTEKISVEIDPRKASDLILDWEKSVSIPNNCLGISGTLQQRRDQVVQILTSFGGVQTAADFERVASVFGFTATVSNGTAHGTFPLVFPIRFFPNISTSSHTILVDLEQRKEVFPLHFPIQFTDGLAGVIECLFRTLAPANCQILYRYGVL